MDDEMKAAAEVGRLAAEEARAGSGTGRRPRPELLLNRRRSPQLNRGRSPQLNRGRSGHGPRAGPRAQMKTRAAPR